MKVNISTETELSKLLDGAIGLYLEFRNVHGYQPQRARDAAISEILEGLVATEDIKQMEQELKSSQAATEYRRLLDMGHSPDEAAAVIDSTFCDGPSN